MMERNVSKQVIVYEPNQQARVGFFASWAGMLRGLIGSRELVWQLFRRDFFADYKQSSLGVLWIFVSPAIGIISWILLNAVGVLRPGNVGVPYPVYVLLGSTIWGLFMSFYSSSAKALSSSSALVLQVKFPHEVLIVKQLAQSSAAFIIQMILILVCLAAFKIVPSWKIVLFPLAMIPLMLVGSGIGIVIAVLNAVIHDVDRAVTALLGLVMYFTPVIYDSRIADPRIQAIIQVNPLSYLVVGARDLILFGRVDNLGMYLSCSGGAVLFFGLCWRIFFLTEHRVIERL
jgi:lipopolysaccharide transport system permease protein